MQRESPREHKSHSWLQLIVGVREDEQEKYPEHDVADPHFVTIKKQNSPQSHGKNDKKVQFHPTTTSEKRCQEASFKEKAKSAAVTKKSLSTKKWVKDWHEVTPYIN